MKVRDYQRQRVYNAERDTPMFVPNAERAGLPTTDFDTTKRFIQNMLKKEWFKDRYPYIAILIVKDGRGCRAARGGNCTVTLPKWSRSPLVILHEVSHAIGRWSTERHGPKFCEHFLYLVYHEMGEKAYQELRWAFLRNRVDFIDPIDIRIAMPPLPTKPKRKPNPKAIEALRKYREAKKAEKMALAAEVAS